MHLVTHYYSSLLGGSLLLAAVTGFDEVEKIAYPAGADTESPIFDLNFALLKFSVRFLSYSFPTGSMLP